MRLRSATKQSPKLGANRAFGPMYMAGNLLSPTLSAIFRPKIDHIVFDGAQ